MTDIERYSNMLVYGRLSKIVDRLYQSILPGEHLVLIITTSDRDINVKELSSYLELIYKVDGSLSALGRARYVQRRLDQIHINQIRAGSVEYIIERALESKEAGGLIVIFLVIKFLPQIVNAVADAVSKYYDVLLKREDLLEKRDRRRIRKQIRSVINEEVELVDLDKKSKEKLVDLLDKIYMDNNRNIVPASRFARNYVKEIKLARKKYN